MIGKTILHYKILEELGRGGMGVVYLAEDSRLERQVAIKFLPRNITGISDERKRFEIEAKAAAALNHPNIATIYAIEESDSELFLVMEYIEGKELKQLMIEDGQLPIEKTLKYVNQIAEGLQAAHDKGITHRDIKSSNIMITKNGKVKIMDFGLAKFRGSAQLTQVGTTLGTVAYMSPEQARGEDADQRADIWSFGVVLYELLTGQLPFPGDYEQAVIYSILNQEPEYPDNIPADLKSILKKLLAKDVTQRYQLMDELLTDLNGNNDSKTHELKPSNVFEEGLRKRPFYLYTGITLILALIITIGILLFSEQKEEQIFDSIAVLPFTDMSPEKDREYFADGMAEEIINSLVQIPNLKVPARTSTFRFKGQNKDIKTIGRELKVSAVLEGSIRKDGDKIRVTAQLIKVDDGFHIWSNTYERQLTDIFEIQDDLSKSIVIALKIKISGDQKLLSHNKPTNVDAYNLYLKGRYFWNRRSREGIVQSIEYFNQAIEVGPTYGLAYAGLADAYNILGVWHYIEPNAAFPKAKAAAEKALEIDESIAEAHTALAYVMHYYDWDWSGAEESFKRAIELKPTYAHVHQWYAELLSVPLNRPQEARIEIEKALELDPLSLIINSVSGYTYITERKIPDAIKQLEKVLKMDKNFIPAHYFLLEIYAKNGFDNLTFKPFKEAFSGFYELDDMENEKLEATFQENGWYGVGEFMIAKHEELEKTRYVSDVWKSLFYVLINDSEQSLVSLERAYEIRNPFIIFINYLPQSGSLNSEPRFQALVKKIGLNNG
jgi:serine/threonine-protein kinase